MSEIRDYIDAVVKMMPEQRMFAFMAAHGREWPIGPRTFAGPRGEPKQCYANASLLALCMPNMTYVEGYVVTASLPPIPHGWCVDADGFVVDPTLAPDADGDMRRVTEYFGVPFRRDYLNKALLVNGVYGLLDICYQHRTLPTLVELGLEAGQQWLIDHPVRRKRGGKLALAALAALLLLQGQPGAQTFYGPDGRVTARQSVSRDGSQTRYGPDGRVESRTTLSRDGTATTYGPDGRVAGRETRQ